MPVGDPHKLQLAGASTTWLWPREDWCQCRLIVACVDLPWASVLTIFYHALRIQSTCCRVRSFIKTALKSTVGSLKQQTLFEMDGLKLYTTCIKNYSS